VKICASFRINWNGTREEDKKKAQYYDSKEIDSLQKKREKIEEKRGKQKEKKRKQG